jgi:hypothetical protein
MDIDPRLLKVSADILNLVPFKEQPVQSWFTQPWFPLLSAFIASIITSAGNYFVSNLQENKRAAREFETRRLAVREKIVEAISKLNLSSKKLEYRLKTLYDNEMCVVDKHLKSACEYYKKNNNCDIDYQNRMECPINSMVREECKSLHENYKNSKENFQQLVATYSIYISQNDYFTKLIYNDIVLEACYLFLVSEDYTNNEVFVFYEPGSPQISKSITKVEFFKCENNQQIVGIVTNNLAEITKAIREDKLITMPKLKI